jgi:HSP20 family protein
MLVRFDPFRDFERLWEQAAGTTRQTAMPMDAYRHGDTFVMHFDLPGVDPASIDLELERNALTVKAERSWHPVEGDDVLAAERLHGTFTRRLYLGDNLDGDRISASYENGVLTLTIPVAERARARKIAVERSREQTAIEAKSA